MNDWRPASGYLTKTGKPKWRCWNESLPSGQKEYETSAGRRWLCDSQSAAQRKCEELNEANQA